MAVPPENTTLRVGKATSGEPARRSSPLTAVRIHAPYPAPRPEKDLAAANDVTRSLAACGSHDGNRRKRSLLNVAHFNGAANSPDRPRCLTAGF